MAAGKKSSRRPSTADGSPQNPSFSHFFPPLRHLDDLALSQNSAGMVFASLHHSAMHTSPFDWPKSRTTSPKPKPVLANHQLKPRDSSVPPRTRHSESKSKSSRHPVSNGQSFPNALSSLTTTTTRTSEPGRSSLSSVPSASVPQSRTQYFVEKRRKRHHAFGRAIPYPLSYEHSVLDHHIIDIEWGIASRKSVSYHVFDTPPKRVLDLGCGTGAWVIKAAQEWKDSHFIGFDLVPIQVNLDLLDPDPPTTSSLIPPIPIPLPLTATTQSHPLPPSHPSSLPLRRANSISKPFVTESANRGRSSSVTSYRTQPSLPSTKSITGARPPSGLSLEALVPAASSDSLPKDPAEKAADETEEKRPLKLNQRIKWVQGNFLEKLPFPDGYFDFIHVRRIARGVPEDKWDHIFSEVNRVLRSGGQVEVIDTNLNFPGGDFYAIHGATASGPPSAPSSPTPGGNKTGILRSPSSPQHLRGVSDDGTMKSFVGQLRRPRASTDSSGSFPSSVPTTSHTIRHHASAPFASLSAAFSSAAYAVGERHHTFRPVSNFFGAVSSSNATPPPIRTHDLPSGTSPHTRGPSSGGISVAPASNLRDPRDHSLLESIYKALHESRFINLTPLSIIQNYLVLHFTQIRSSAPLIMLAPERKSGLGEPSTGKAIGSPGRDRSRSEDGFEGLLKAVDSTRGRSELLEEDEDGIMDGTPTNGIIDAATLNHSASKILGVSMVTAKLEDALRPGSDLRRSTSTPVGEHLSLAPSTNPSPLLPSPQIRPMKPKSTSPSRSATASVGTSTRKSGHLRVEDFLTTDPSRVANRVVMSKTSKEGCVKSDNGLPNQNFEFDVAHAGLHLSVAVADVLGCVEEMWEYVKREDELADRSVFDDMVTRYKVDMHDRIGLTSTLEDRLGWEGRVKGGQSQLQKDFEEQLQRVLDEEPSSDSFELQRPPVLPGVTGKGEPEGNKSSTSTRYTPQKAVKPRDASLESYANGKMVSRTFRVWCAVKP